MKLRQTLQFLLYEWLDTEALCQRPRFGDHSRETFDAVLDTCERIARDLPMDRLEAMVQPATLTDLPGLGRDILKGQVRGRVVVDVNA